MDVSEIGYLMLAGIATICATIIGVGAWIVSTIKEQRPEP